MRKAAALPILLLTLAAGASAQVKPDLAIAYRRSAMTMIGWNFGPLSAMVKGKTAFDAKEFAHRAERLAFFSEQILEGFPQGSDKGAETDAKADIWTHFDDFTAKANDFIHESKALDAAAKTGDEARMKDQFRKLAGTCKGCHEKYKAD
ncbi:MAG TPA: cytochrome c [Rudaea sp.]